MSVSRLIKLWSIQSIQREFICYKEKLIYEIIRKWMDLENIILSEATQILKDKSYVLSQMQILVWRECVCESV